MGMDVLTLLEIHLQLSDDATENVPYSSKGCTSRQSAAQHMVRLALADWKAAPRLFYLLSDRHWNDKGCSASNTFWPVFNLYNIRETTENSTFTK